MDIEISRDRRNQMEWNWI